MSDQNKEQEEAVNQIYEFAADLMVKKGMSSVETKKALITQGLDNESATIVVDNLEQQIKKAKKGRGSKDMLFGALWLFGGIIVTTVTYSSASSGGGRYVVAYGAIIFGAIQFIRGIARSL
jgi:hypothetical protein